MDIIHVFTCFVCVLAYGNSLPPSACFESFNWEDCGRPPVHVIYYYKPGSRCEVGIWRGCYPNMNMFKDEYECVDTCIYFQRAQPEVFHLADYENINDAYPDYTTVDGNDTDYTLTTDEITETVIDGETNEPNNKTNTDTISDNKSDSTTGTVSSGTGSNNENDSEKVTKSNDETVSETGIPSNNEAVATDAADAAAPADPTEAPPTEAPAEEK